MTGSDQRPQARDGFTVTTVTDLIEREHGAAELAPLPPAWPHADENPPRTLATGFAQLDDVLGGGFQCGELVLVRGRTGIGKTLAALQWTRWFAAHEHTVLYVCRRHTPRSLLGRLVALELGSHAREDELPTLRTLRKVARDLALGSAVLPELIAEPLGEEAIGRLRSCGDRIEIVPAPDRVDVAALADLVASRETRAAVFVDTLREGPRREEPGAPSSDAIDGGATFGGLFGALAALKDLAAQHAIVVVALAKSHQTNAEAAYEVAHATELGCDVALTLRSGASLPTIDVGEEGVRAFVGSVVVDVAVNRLPKSVARLEFAKDLHRGRFDTEGRVISRA